MSLVKVVRWNDGQRSEHMVEPTPFGAERAKEVWQQRGLEMDLPALTLGEEAYVRTIWKRMPGHTCFMDAFFRILTDPAESAVDLDELPLEFVVRQEVLRREERG